MEKRANGVLWDSEIEENLSNIPDDFFTIDLDGTEKTKYYRFKDGSYVSVSVKPDKNIKIDGSKTSRDQWERTGKSTKEYDDLLESSLTMPRYGHEQGSYHSWYWNYYVQKDFTHTFGGFFTEFIVVNGSYDRFYFSSSGSGRSGTYGFAAHRAHTLSFVTNIDEKSPEYIREQENAYSPACVGFAWIETLHLEGYDITRTRLGAYAKIANNNVTIGGNVNVCSYK